jgi:hypothetical protein
LIELEQHCSDNIKDVRDLNIQIKKLNLIEKQLILPFTEAITIWQAKKSIHHVKIIN